MKKLFVLLVVAFASIVPAQNYPYFAQPQGYLMNDGAVQNQQNMNSIANWWGCRPGKITDTCPITMITKYSDSLWCYAISNYTATDILVNFIGYNNHADTIPIVVPAGGETPKLPRLWKLVSTDVTSSTLYGLVFWFQNGKKNPNDL